ncbi:Serine--tRNA ligase, mitochondrial [Paramarasmius palmivorus]|uniref:serine--tRNA ligase n=1 Tax=Paramarasmius palmivorus TaxID=297713 RepID=A0AAW0E511_9AGAR
MSGFHSPSSHKACYNLKNLCKYLQRPVTCRYSSTLRHGRQEIPQPRLNYRDIAENSVSKSLNALNRKAPLPTDGVESVVRLYKEFKTVKQKLDAKRNERSMVGETIERSAKAKDAETKAAALRTAKELKEEISELELATSQIENEMLGLALAIPNDTHASSPLGPESAAEVLDIRGPTPLPANPNRDHADIARKLNLIDFESGAKVTGSSWYYLLNEAAILEMALTNYALSVAMRHGYTPVTTPDVVRSDIARRCGFQPRDHSDPPVAQAYHLQSTSPNSSELILAGTAEIPLAGMFANRVHKSPSLPLKVVGIGHAFRAEAGASGTDTRGIYRVHQFSKVELFAVTKSEESEETMEAMRLVQQEILDGLRIPYRVLDMPTEELGASAYRKYDMEAWMPGRGGWGEVMSLSNCTDYQARRLHIRYTTPKEPSVSVPNPTLFAHTLNGTAAAIPRLIVALLENGIELDEAGEPIGLILPSTLRPFWLQTNSRDLVKWDS